MIPRGAEISIFRIPLDVAGQTVLRQVTGYFHLWQFERSATGGISLDGQVTACFGSQATADDAIPFAYNSRMQFRPPVELVTLRWEAQPGLRAVIVVSPSPDALEASNIPARQLVFQGQATAIATGVAPVTTATTQLIPANAFRQRLIVQAPVTNPATVVVGEDLAVTLADGIQIEPGGSLVLTSSAALFGLAGAAGQLRWLEERA